jgi:hypothetical protein
MTTFPDYSKIYSLNSSIAAELVKVTFTKNMLML